MEIYSSQLIHAEMNCFSITICLKGKKKVVKQNWKAQEVSRWFQKSDMHPFVWS